MTVGDRMKVVQITWSDKFGISTRILGVENLPQLMYYNLHDFHMVYKVNVLPNILYLHVVLNQYLTPLLIENYKLQVPAGTDHAWLVGVPWWEHLQFDPLYRISSTLYHLLLCGHEWNDYRCVCALFCCEKPWKAGFFVISIVAFISRNISISPSCR